MAEFVPTLNKESVLYLLKQVQAAILFDNSKEVNECRRLSNYRRSTTIQSNRSSATSGGGSSSILKIVKTLRLGVDNLERDSGELPSKSVTFRVGNRRSTLRGVNFTDKSFTGNGISFDSTIPYFVITTRQKNILTKIYEELKGLSYIHKTSFNTGVVSLRLVTEMQRIYRSHVRRYVFACWRQGFQDRKLQKQKLARFFPSTTIPLADIFYQWRILTSARPLYDLKQNLEDMKVSNTGLAQEVEHLTTYSVVHHQTSLHDAIIKKKNLEKDIKQLRADHEALKIKSENADVVSRRKVLFAKLHAVSDHIAQVQ